jgi:hypothetical protein
MLPTLTHGWTQIAKYSYNVGLVDRDWKVWPVEECHVGGLNGAAIR